ncbi:MAG TPA: SRPBCC domain-containing protein [Thermoanaerobaculia bacterium]|nr:SRPBCC domain-containing protein [Thermoanaerobaculia bacterium]
MPDINHMIIANASPEAVLPLVATAEGLAQWWAEDVATTSSPETVELGFFNRTTIYRLTRSRDQKDGEVRWSCSTGAEWEGTTISFHLEAIPAGTRLRFSHSDWAAATDYFTSCNTTWGELMFRLKAAAEGQAPGPLFLRDGMAY